MPRNMSFMLTTDQIRNRTKTVTRRTGWWEDKHGRRILNVGDIVNACVKCQGLKPGEKIERLCQIRITDVRREPLSAMDNQGVPGEPSYGDVEAAKEGFPLMGGHNFVTMFCEHMGGTADQEVTRIEFEYLDANCHVQRHDAT